MKTISIGKDYSDTPLGRYEGDGPFNGTRFREEFLRPALESGEAVHVKIDDTEGYGSSFLDEAFGGLVRFGYFSASELQSKLVIELEDQDYNLYKNLIWRYIDSAQPAPK